MFRQTVLPGFADPVAGAEGRRRLRELTRAAVDRYVEEELGGLEHQTERFRYLFRRLLRSVQAVVDNVAEELAASQFRPISFELGFGSGQDLPPVELSVDGMTVSISGFVDRVEPSASPALWTGWTAGSTTGGSTCGWWTIRRGRSPST